MCLTRSRVTKQEPSAFKWSVIGGPESDEWITRILSVPFFAVGITMILLLPLIFKNMWDYYLYFLKILFNFCNYRKVINTKAAYLSLTVMFTVTTTGLLILCCLLTVEDYFLSRKIIYIYFNPGQILPGCSQHSVSRCRRSSRPGVMTISGRGR